MTTEETLTKDLTVTSWTGDIVKENRTQVLNEVIEKIEATKNKVQEICGTTKYDYLIKSCYDDCITICNNLMK